MANLSNINGKFLFTDGDFLLIGGATANSISATESGVAIKNSNAATLSLQNSATNGKNHTLWSNTDGSFNITDVGVATRFTIASGGDVYIPSGNVSIGNNSVASSGSNTILEIYSVSVPRLKLKNSTTGTAELAGSSFYLTGDDLIINNGETSGVIQFEIGGGTPIMRMKYGGNVGIGTIFPTAKLQVENTSAGAATVAAFLVNSNITVNTETRLAFAAHTNSDIATNRYSYISTINTTGSNGQDMVFATNVTGASAVERMRIKSFGTTMITKAQVTSLFDTTSFLRLHPSTTVNSGGFTNMFFGTSELDNFGISLGGLRTGTTGIPTFIIKTHNNDATGVERMRIDSSGLVKINERIQVGIRTASDASIIAQSSDIQLRIGSTSNANNPYIRFQANNGSGGTYADIQLDPVNQLLKFNDPGTSSGSIGTNPMVLDASGNVGIGTASPSSYYADQLVVKCSSVENGITIASNSTNDANYLMFADGTSGPQRYEGYIEFNHSTNLMSYRSSGEIRFLANVVERMRITSDGTIEIRNGGTNGGEIKLTGTDNDLTINGARSQIIFQINGTNAYEMDSVQLYPSADNSKNLGTSSLRWSTVYAVNGINTSDETLKENIEECDLGIDFIDSLKPKSYNFKDLKEDNDAYGKKRYGLIAQDLLQTELKDSVFGEKDGEYGLSYNDLIAPMIKSIQELKAEIELLKTQINN